MNEIIPVQTKDNIQVVSARDLHKGLGLKTRFNEWVSQNFKSFDENEDFMSAVTTADMPNGGVKQINDYLLTIDMAKELCMMSKTEKGKEVRKYFIQVEKNWNSPEMVMNRALQISKARVEQLQLENKNLTLRLEESNKKASYLDVILGTPDLLATTQIAADYGYSAKSFNLLLKEAGIQHKVNGQWILYKVYMGKGYVASKAFTFQDHKGKDRSKTTTYWTQKGRKLIYDVLKDREILPLIERDDIA